MAEIVVHKLYEEKERQYIIDAYENFGKKTARKWKEELKKIQNFLKKYPEAKPPFLGAPKFSYLLRGANFMRNFKLVYYYDESLDVVHIVDIWDMRQNPKRLSVSKYK
jgi:hypothetical protein